MGFRSRAMQCDRGMMTSSLSHHPLRTVVSPQSLRQLEPWVCLALIPSLQHVRGEQQRPGSRKVSTFQQSSCPSQMGCATAADGVVYAGSFNSGRWPRQPTSYLTASTLVSHYSCLINCYTWQHHWHSACTMLFRRIASR